MIVNCAHPVPVRYVPYRGRSEHVSYVRRTTPVELRTLPESEFESVSYRPPQEALFKQSKGGDRDPELFVHGGRLWQRLAVFGQSADDRRFSYRNFMKPDDFVAILEGRDPGQDDFGKHFAQTPLAALMRRAGAWRGHDLDIVSRGGPEPAGMARGRIVADLHGPAEDALRRLFEEEIALVGEDVLVRVAGPLYVHDSHLGAGGLRVTLFPRMFSSSGTPYRTDGLGAVLSHLVRSGVDGDVPQLIPPGRIDLPRHLLGNDDLGIFALETTRALSRDLDVHMSVSPEGAWRANPHVLPLAARLADESALSRIGSLPPMPLEDRLAGLLADIDLVSGLHRVPPYALSRAAAYIADYALPRLGAKESIELADEEALGGIAP